MPTVRRSNSNAFKTLNTKLKELEGVETKVGWFPGAKYEDGTPVAMAAAANEIGHGSTPPRPSMRPTAVAKRQEWKNTARQVSAQTLEGKITAHDAMDTLGSVVEGDILTTIAGVNSPPLSPVTIELRAMKKRDPTLKVTAATVGQAAARIREPGYVAPAGVSVKPLNDSGLMIATLTHITEGS